MKGKMFGRKKNSTFRIFIKSNTFIPTTFFLKKSHPGKFIPTKFFIKHPSRKFLRWIFVKSPACMKILEIEMLHVRKLLLILHMVSPSYILPNAVAILHGLNYLNWPDTSFLIARGSRDHDIIVFPPFKTHTF